MWPGMLGLTATFSPEVMKRFGEIVSEEYRALGLTTALFPQVDIGTDPRWFRYNYTLGEDPNLAVDLAKAYTEGLQTDTITEVENGWGYKSVNAMVKHWPGTGACGEGGRDGHYNFGKYAVFPNHNFAIHTRPFLEGALSLDGPTHCASALMPDYSVCVSVEPTGVAPGFSPTFIDKMLRTDNHFDGVVCTVPAYSGYWEEQNEEKTVTPLSDKIISKYFKHAATPAEADFAIVFIDSPFGCYGYDYSKLATSTDAYLPISLQYKPYTATAAREKTIAGENRSYKGRSATVANSTDYNLVRDVRAAIGNKPLVVVVNTTNPFVISEIEPLADAILLTFDVQNQAALEIISGRHEPSALLPFVMPAEVATVEQQAEDIPFDMIPYKDAAGNEYIFGYGLNWSGIIRDARTEKYGITKSQLNPAPQAAAE